MNEQEVLEQGDPNLAKSLETWKKRLAKLNDLDRQAGIRCITAAATWLNRAGAVYDRVNLRSALEAMRQYAPWLRDPEIRGGFVALAEVASDALRRAEHRALEYLSPDSLAIRALGKLKEQTATTFGLAAALSVNLDEAIQAVEGLLEYGLIGRNGTELIDEARGRQCRWRVTPEGERILQHCSR